MAHPCLNSTNEALFVTNLVLTIIRDDDGAHVFDLLKLLKTTGAHESGNGDQAMRLLATKTADFDRWYQDFVRRL
jgi:hypothetical protein